MITRIEYISDKIANSRARLKALLEKKDFQRVMNDEAIVLENIEKNLREIANELKEFIQ